MVNQTAQSDKTLQLEQILDDVSLDGFHDNSFKVFQPSNRGLRSGLDALLLASALPQDASGTLADLGAGCGLAGLAALNLNSDLKLLSVERNNLMVALEHQTLVHADNKYFQNRVTVLQADIALSGLERENAGLIPSSVSHVIMNPPYNGDNLQSPPEQLKKEALMLGKGGFDAWFRTAASITKSGGQMVIINRTENLGQVIACSQGRFGKLEIIPIHSRAQEPAKRILVRGIRDSRAPMSILPGFVVHEADGGFTKQADRIFKGRQSLRI